MPDFPLIGDGQYAQSIDSGHISHLSIGADVTSAGSANAKGSWQELIASTSHAGSAILVMLSPFAGGIQNYLLDIGIGGAGSEVVLAPNLMYLQGNQGNSVSAYGGVNYLIPISVPAGSRISARLQCGVASKDVGVYVTVFGTGMLPSCPLQRITAYGANTGSTRGTTVDPGGTADTYGSWTQITASTTNPIRQLVLAVGWGASWSDSVGAWWAIDIGIGGSGSETVIVPKLNVRRYDNNGGISCPQPASFPPLPVSIPAGTRLAARAAPFSSIGTATNREIELIAYGVD